MRKGDLIDKSVTLNDNAGKFNDNWLIGSD
jgi:hypothetical protein